MLRTNPSVAAAAPQSFLECLGYFLTPRVWRQAHQALRCRRRARWRAPPLLWVLLTMTWCAGDSLAERFETARAFYIACAQRRRRPGKTVEGWQKALARVPAAALRAVAAVLRARLGQVFAARWLVDGFVPLGCDGSRLNCPRSPELEARLGIKRRRKKGQGPLPPQMRVTALVHLGLGLLWSWRLGRATASERQHLLAMLPALPRRALLVADAGFIGYELVRTLMQSQVSFLIRLSSVVPLYAAGRPAPSRFRDGVLYYWPQDQQEGGQPPVAVRVLRIRRGGRKRDVWLMTNVFEAARLPLASASRFYRWRWRNEGLFRTYKRALGKVKLMSRTVALGHREAEGSLLAVQLLLAQGALAVPAAAPLAPGLCSARGVLREIRAEIRDVTGMYLGPRQARTYRQRLEGLRVDGRQGRRNKVRRRWPGRADHKPPGPPRILRMGTLLKDLAEKTLGVAVT
jgi:hypothetical protein